MRNIALEAANRLSESKKIQTAFSFGSFLLGATIGYEGDPNLWMTMPKLPIEGVVAGLAMAERANAQALNNAAMMEQAGDTVDQIDLGVKSRGAMLVSGFMKMGQMMVGSLTGHQLAHDTPAGYVAAAVTATAGLAIGYLEARNNK